MNIRSSLFALFFIFMVIPKAVCAGNSDRSFPWGGEKFAILVEESFRQNNAGEARQFFKLTEKVFDSYPNKPVNLGLNGFLDMQNRKIKNLRTSAEKTRAQLDLSRNLHLWVKKTIPKFNLDRGFEFSSVVLFGERQCFLQSVLIAGLLQKAGADAGVVMVFRNPKGESSNNGHAAVLLKLPDGHDVIVDASDPEPFIPHKGLFVDRSGYLFVSPIYEKDFPWISRYKPASGGTEISTTQVEPLDYSFIRSQFWYYRGERVPGGLLAGRQSAKKLEIATGHFRKSVQLCANNPLAVYMLGRALLAQGKTKEARRYLESSINLYTRFGWVPDGPRDYLARAK